MRRLLVLCSVIAAAAMWSAASADIAAQARGGQPGGPGGGQADPWPNSKKLLAVADVQSGFHHDSISHALATVEQIGRKANAYVTMIRTDSQLITKGQIIGKGRYEGRGVNARTLDYYDAIFMLPERLWHHDGAAEERIARVRARRGQGPDRRARHRRGIH